MRFEGGDHDRVLVRTNEIIYVHNGSVIAYTSMYKCNPVQCIGVVQCAKIINSETAGIYVMPVKMCIDKRWYNILPIKVVPRKPGSYPELLVSILDLSTITNYIPPIECYETIELDLIKGT